MQRRRIGVGSLTHGFSCIRGGKRLAVMASQMRRKRKPGITEDERNELLARIDEAVDDSPKSRVLKNAVESLPSAEERGGDEE